jgi:hypothetical protein
MLTLQTRVVVALMLLVAFAVVAAATPGAAQEDAIEGTPIVDPPVEDVCCCDEPAPIDDEEVAATGLKRASSAAMALLPRAQDARSGFEMGKPTGGRPPRAGENPNSYINYRLRQDIDGEFTTGALSGATITASGTISSGQIRFGRDSTKWFIVGIVTIESPDKKTFACLDVQLTFTNDQWTGKEIGINDVGTFKTRPQPAPRGKFRGGGTYRIEAGVLTENGTKIDGFLYGI